MYLQVAKTIILFKSKLNKAIMIQKQVQTIQNRSKIRFFGFAAVGFEGLNCFLEINEGCLNLCFRSQGGVDPKWLVGEE